MSRKMPKVIIYMSCYNHEKYVNEAMDSIIGQTYENWELYVVNDGSTDRTGEIISTYKDERIHFFDFKKNTKFVGAINFLEDICRNVDGDYMASMSSDDFWEKDKLERQVNFLQEHPEYKACFTWDKLLFSSDNKGSYENRMSYSHKKNKNRYEWLNHFFWDGNCLNECSMLMDKQVFFEFNGKNQYYYQLSDFRLWYLFCVKYSFYLIEDELTWYRRHETNLSEQSNEVVLRDVNEKYQIEKEIIVTMDKDTFRRAFYKNLPYVKCDTEEELLAEKFILLLGSNIYARGSKEQIALDIFFANSRNREFVSVLKEKYFFDTQDFLDLSGNGGMTDILFGFNERKTFSPAFILIEAINAGKVRRDNLDLYRYSTLLDLWDITSMYEGGREQFNKFKSFIINIQQERKRDCRKNKILFLVAQSSKLEISKKIKKKTEEGAECYVAYVPSWEEAMSDVSAKYNLDRPVEGAELVTLYDEKEHKICFMHELSKTIDSICYVDCLDKEYESNSIAAGYSLAVEYSCILKKESYQDMLQNDEKILAMMKEIEIY